MLKRVTIFLVTMLTLVGCFKDDTFDSTLIFRSVQQSVSGGEYTDLSGVRVYAFAADTTSYTPLNYAEAAAGTITNKVSGETLQPIAVSEEYSGEFTYTYHIEEEEDNYFTSNDDDDNDNEEIIHPYEDGEKVTTTITGVALQAKTQYMMLVAVDTVNGDYAYCNYEVGFALPQTYITLTFRPWRNENFAQSFWWFVVE